MVRRSSLNGVTPGGHQPRFPGFDVLSQTHMWDPITAGVVLARLGPHDAVRFFTPSEQAIARALLDQLLDQREDPKVPVLEMLDSRLVEESTDGWRYEDLPEDGQAWKQSIGHLDEDAQSEHSTGFALLSWEQQSAIIQAVQDLKSDKWHGMTASRVWSLWTRYACTAYYSHPWAWNEIGFPGPAYPRGYKNATVGGREPFEVADHHQVDPLKQN